VEKQGDKWVITFASKGKCDATVAIVGPDGKIVRHLASGVLGPNAPHPFQQNSLSQRIEWDGLTDDFKKAPSGCKVRVSLGLQAKYERDIAWAPKKGTCIERDGKYFRTIFPPPMDTPPDVLAGTTTRLATTVWGEKIPVGVWFSPFGFNIHEGIDDAAIKKIVEKLTPLFSDKAPPRKLDFAPTTTPTAFDGPPRIAVDPVSEDIYWMTPGGTPGGFVMRYSGKTGQFDAEFNKSAKGEPGRGAWSNVSEMDFGPDGLIYLTCGAFHSSWFMIRVDRSWKGVPFTDKSETRALKDAGSGEVSIEGVMPKGGWWDRLPAAVLDSRNGISEAIWTGGLGGSNVHDPGFDVSLSGHIVVIPQQRKPEWCAAHKCTDKDNVVQVWTLEGKLLNADALGAAFWGHGVRMDRDGNLYIVAGGVMPPGQDKLYGIADVKVGYRVFGGHGTLLKFRGLGSGKFALDEGRPVKVGQREIKALWAFAGISNASGGDCSCNHNRFDLDGYARSWIPTRHLCSVLVLDANCNLVARFGRYGNIDDADPRCGGIHLVNPRGVAVSDTGLYILDADQRRLFKAALSYAAEETAPVP
ncbi:MAG: hypothetical protein N3A38_16220, partial [Planctomycetota bacterium]|nr:hypothetical protein [Planctomycetota bacterium]